MALKCKIELMKTVEKYLYKISYWIFDQYYRVRGYMFRGEYDKKHIIFQKDGSQIKISIKNHEDFVEEKQKKIDDFKKKKNESEYIQFALKEAIDGCNFVVFIKEKRIVQFWTGKGRLDFYFPLKAKYGNKPYYYQTLGLLVDMNFLPDSVVATRAFSFRLSTKDSSYQIVKDGELSMLSGYFGKQTVLGAEFVLRMFKEIYKTKKGEVKIEVG